MAHWLGEAVKWPSAVTDASGFYRITFDATTLRRDSGRFAARAEVIAQGYEQYWRSLVATTDSPFVEHFRLYRTQHVAAGNSIVVSYPPDIGECPGWVAQVCGTVRVSVPATGNMRVEVIATDQTAVPTLEICCVSGDEVYGNPLTVPVQAGTESIMRIELKTGATTSQSFVVKTSLDRSH